MRNTDAKGVGRQVASPYSPFLKNKQTNKHINTSSGKERAKM